MFGKCVGDSDAQANEYSLAATLSLRKKRSRR